MTLRHAATRPFMLKDFSIKDPNCLDHDRNNDVIWQDYDIEEDDSYYFFVLNMPGIKAKEVNVDVECDDHVLDLNGTLHREDSLTPFFERFYVGDCVDSRFVDACVMDGRLIIRAKKRESNENLIKNKANSCTLGSEIDIVHERMRRVNLGAVRPEMDYGKERVVLGAAFCPSPPSPLTPVCTTHKNKFGKNFDIVQERCSPRHDGSYRRFMPPRNQNQEWPKKSESENDKERRVKNRFLRRLLRHSATS